MFHVTYDTKMGEANARLHISDDGGNTIFTCRLQHPTDSKRSECEKLQNVLDAIYGKARREADEAAKEK